MSVGPVGTACSSVAPAPLGQRITCNLGSRTWRVSAAQSTSYSALATETIRSTTMVIMDPLLACGTCMYDKISGFCEPFSDYWSLQLNLGTNISAHLRRPWLIENRGAARFPGYDPTQEPWYPAGIGIGKNLRYFLGARHMKILFYVKFK